jgi:hypothetical protein
MGIRVVKPPKKATFINNRKPNFKRPRCRTLPVGRNGQALFRSLLKFDLSSLPPFLNIINGTLNLSLVKNDFPCLTKTVTVHQILSEWSEKTLSFNRQPLFNPTPISQITLTNQNNIFVSFGLTPLIRNWYNGTEANLGILLKMSNEYMNEIVFSSKDYPNSKLWPYIQVDFLDPPDTTNCNVCCHPIEVTMNAVTDDKVLWTNPLNTLMFNYTYIVINTGSTPAVVTLQSSPDGFHWGTESATVTILPNKIINLVPDHFVKYSRLSYQSALFKQSTTLAIHVQGRS